jgi:general secretion pathway protein D
VVSSVLFSSCSTTSKPKNPCTNIVECTNLATELTSKKYINVGEPLKGEVQNFGDVKWTKENADYLFGEALASTGYARETTIDKDIYNLINARDVRYSAGSISYAATKTTNDEMLPPNHADFVELVYKSENGDRVGDMARNLRPFMSRYGRIIDIRSSSTIILRDTSKTVQTLLPMIRRFDVPLTKEEMNSKKQAPKK